MNNFVLKADYKPAGDQPSAIRSIVNNIRNGVGGQTLLGVTGSGKTFTMANVIAELNRPALVLAHNKTLAAQLYSEFEALFPENAVRYFVSYYDYYQPEAYIPSTDTYISKDSAINHEIDKLRHAATKSLLERRDVIVVASVSCIYALGDPKEYFDMMLYVETGDTLDQDDVLKKLTELHFEIDDVELLAGSFRIRGDSVQICPASETDKCICIEFFSSRVESISEINKLTGQVIRVLDNACVYPASHFVTTKDKLQKAILSIKEELDLHLNVLSSQGKLSERNRLEQRTLFDLELLEETGLCSGIENYSRHMTARKAGEPPPTLIDYCPSDTIFFIDESHVTVPQLVGMYRGDRARKETLIEFGFRLPSALDNRPLRFDEFMDRVKTRIYTSATPGEFEWKDSSGNVVEQIIRPTGLVDPVLEVRPASSQVDDFLSELELVIRKNERAMVTTLTKKLSEHLSEYYANKGIRVKYLHSEIPTLDRLEIIRGLQVGEYDLLVGVNLLREGLDMPEVSLIGIMDADKEGFLRSATSLIQTIGRAARNINGKVVLYGDSITNSMDRAILETNRRRNLQEDFNVKNGISPKNAVRMAKSQVAEKSQKVSVSSLSSSILDTVPLTKKEAAIRLRQMRKSMLEYAKKMNFEKAAEIRNRISELEKLILEW